MATPRAEPLQVGAADPITPVTVTIANGQQVSGAADFGPRDRLHRFVTPAALTGTAFTFQEADGDGSTYKDVYKEGTLYSVSVGADRSVMVDQALFYAIRRLKVKSGSAEGAARDIVLITEPR